MMTSPSTADANWASYQREGIRLYETIRSSAGRLRAALELVEALRDQPLEMKREIGHILLLLHHAHPYPQLYESALELILATQRWTVYLESWTDWERELRFYAAVAGSLGLPDYQAQLLDRLAAVLLNLGRGEEADRFNREALQNAFAAGAMLPAVKATTTRVEFLLTRGRTADAETAIAEMERALAQHPPADTCEQGEVLAHLWISRAQLSRRQGDLDGALAAINRAVDSLTACEEPDLHLQASIYRLRGLYCWAKGFYDEAIPNLTRSARLFRQQGDQYAASLALGNLGLVYWSTSRFDAAEEVTDFTIRQARRLNARWHLARQTGNLALVSLFQGRLREAHRLVRRHLRLSAELGITGEVGRAKGNMGVIKLHLGLYQAAYPLLEHDRHISEEQGKLEGLGVILANLSRYYMLTGDAPTAADFAERTLRLSDRLNSAPLRLIGLRVLAECQPPRRAKRTLRTAYYLAEDRPFDRAACLLRYITVVDDDTLKTHLWAKAEGMLDHMGAPAWTRRSTLAKPPLLPVVI
jgi:tetratricopeptide (TPR) repeat protein